MALTNRTLVIMAKAPRPGSVKTRLTTNLTAQQVTELYECLLRDTIALAKSLDPIETAIMCPEPDADELTRCIDRAVPVVPQTGRGLAAGLTSVFAHFTNLGRQRVIAFNSDSPHLPPSVLQNAFNALEKNDLVVGPTHDGGYYLVGANGSHPTLFEDAGMGTRSALDALLGRARELQLSTVFTDTFYDVDVASDLARLAEELQLAPAKAPRTAAWLKEWAAAGSIPHLWQRAGNP